MVKSLKNTQSWKYFVFEDDDVDDDDDEDDDESQMTFVLFPQFLPSYYTNWEKCRQWCCCIFLSHVEGVSSRILTDKLFEFKYGIVTIW